MFSSPLPFPLRFFPFHLDYMSFDVFVNGCHTIVRKYFEENHKCQCGLDVLEAFLRQLAEKYNCPLVDYKAQMQPMLTKRNIICEDRVHPTAEGHHVMAQTFLCDIEEKENRDFDCEFVFEEWNKKRYDAEQKMHGIRYVEFCALFNPDEPEKTYEEKKKIARERYEAAGDKTLYVPGAYKEYTEKIDFYGQMLGEVARLTIF